MRCERCQSECLSTICSMFNTDMVCRDCKRKEEAHPEYENARSAEMAAVQSGDYNFPGIGKPADL
jgi:hypothetical protein